MNVGPGAGGIGNPYYMGLMNLFVSGLTPAYYAEIIAELEEAKRQAERIAAGEGWDGCTVCGDNDHHAGECWFHNIVLLAELGRIALTGEFWRCFQCGGVFTTEAGALAHFGDSPEAAAECVRYLAGSLLTDGADAAENAVRAFAHVENTADRGVAYMQLQAFAARARAVARAALPAAEGL